MKKSKYRIPGICGQNKGIIVINRHFSSITVADYKKTALVAKI
jgi:hypothetical protein